MPSYRRGPLGWLVVAMVVFTLMMVLQQFRSTDKITLDEFEAYLEKGQIEKVVIRDTKIVGKFNARGVAARPANAPQSFTVNYPRDWVEKDLRQKMLKKGVKVEVADQHIWLLMFVQWVLPLIVIIGLASTASRTRTESRSRSTTLRGWTRQRKKWRRLSSF